MPFLHCSGFGIGSSFVVALSFPSSACVCLASCPSVCARFALLSSFVPLFVLDHVSSAVETKELVGLPLDLLVLDVDGNYTYIHTYIHL